MSRRPCLVRPRVAAIAALVVLVACVNARPAGAGRAERARYLMGTLCTVEVEAADSLIAGAAAEAALDTVARLEDVMSSWRPTSELCALNATAGAGPFLCSPDLYAVLDSALAVARETVGAFDPTVEALDRAWDLRGKGRVPTPRELALARASVGYAGLTLDPTTRGARLARSGLGVDLGGIGKGYALDCAARVLAAHGATAALLNFGGEILASGAGAPHAVALADPADRLRPVLFLTLQGRALSVSGQGEHFVVVRGRRYGHIVDPRTGRPLSTRASVAVVARSGSAADGLSTALLVLGRERARALVAAHPDLSVVWMERRGAVLRAWRWNLPALATARGVHVAWQP